MLATPKRPSIHAQARWRVRLENHAGRRATGRAVDRMLLALRAYEQRARRRAAFTPGFSPVVPRRAERVRVTAQPGR